MAGKHTPGPYAHGEMTMTKADWAALRGEGLLTIVQKGPDVLAIVYCDDDHDEGAQADLFAEAPGMLEALKRIATADEFNTNSAGLPEFKSWVRAVANTAIARAEGR